MGNVLKRFAVFREPDHVLVGVESETFNVIQLAEIYGSGDYQIARFEDGKEIRRYRQIVDDRLGAPKKTEPLPESALPITK
jgi:hypothetical protein